MATKKKKSNVDLIVNELVSTLKDTKEFVLEQAPDVAKQMVAERAVELKYDAFSCTLIVLGLIATIAGAFYWPEHSDGALFIRGALGIIAAVAFLPMLTCLIDTFKRAAALKVAPKVYLLERLRDLVSE